jgi:hypothetical protein
VCRLFGGGLGRVIAVAVVDDDVRAGAAERDRDRLADAAVGAGNEGFPEAGDSNIPIPDRMDPRLTKAARAPISTPV